LIAYADHVASATVWQAKYYVFNVYSRRKMEEKLTYLHQNPVRAGPVRDACHWRFSSARHDELNKSVGVKVGWLE
jgi:putative transposase